MNIFDFFTQPANWVGSEGIPGAIGLHLMYSGISLLIALAIAVPLGVYVGYTGRGEAVVAGLANALRALPTLGLLILVVMILAPVFGSSLAFVLPTIVVLVLLAVPPILTGTYSGIQAADPDAVGAARGMGYTKAQILWHIQLPCALPLLLSGIRGATLQIVSTATVAAYVGLGGLGRFIIDGRAQGDYSKMAAGAILVALLALVLELAFIAIGRLVISPGLQRTTRRSRKTPAPPQPQPPAPAQVLASSAT
ncbi:ABC transporter permease [Arthrobacter sp. 35W]|uniref:ABC transporter permease n=1 Tax=Arthrobacter sp. 35W TaxID=1132441 RepID=UPI0003FA247A|nr:ABC transporter permease [Arthrobacter sp. 35W]